MDLAACVPTGGLLRVMHQPNFMAYGWVFSVLKRLQVEAITAGGRALFVSIDYDSVGDERLHSVRVPDARRDCGYRTFSLGKAGSRHRTRVANRVELPGLDWLESWRRSWSGLGHYYAERNPSDDTLPDAIAACEQIVLTAHRGSASLVDFLEGVVSGVSEVCLSEAPVIMRSSEIWRRASADKILALVEGWTRIARQARQTGDSLTARGFDPVEIGRLVRATQELPLWYVCGCGSRRHIGADSWIQPCDHCKDPGRLSRRNVIELIASRRDSLIPATALTAALNKDCYGMSGGVAHRGGAGHLIFNSLVLERSGLSSLPQISVQFSEWVATGLNRGSSSEGALAAEQLDASGYASMLFTVLGRSFRTRLLELHPGSEA